MRKPTDRRPSTFVLVMPLVALAGLGAFGACSAPVDPGVVDHGSVSPVLSSSLAAYDVIAQQPVDHRKAAYRVLTLAEKGALWRTHLESFTRPPSELSPMQTVTASSLLEPLTDTQRHAIRTALDSLPKLFDEQVPLEQRRALANRLCEFGRSGFTREQAGEIFGTLGPSNETGSATMRLGSRPNPLAGSSLLSRSMRAPASGMAVSALLPRCDCDASSWCGCRQCSGNNPEGGTYVCEYPYPDYFECGCLWYWPCNGICQS
jgi:hypothetical protein